MSKQPKRITRTVLKRTPVWLSRDLDGMYEFWSTKPRWVDNNFWNGRKYLMEWDASNFEAFAPSLKLDPGQCVRCVKITTDKGFILERDE